MTVYFLKKYWIGMVVAILLVVIGVTTMDNFDEGMFFAMAMGIFVVIFAIIASGNSSSPKRAIIIIGAVIGMIKFAWYLLSLQPLRRWVSRWRVKGVSPAPYPYLALYGSVTDTQAMLQNHSSCFCHDKTPVVRATLWRLLSRGVLHFGADKSGNVAIKLGDWKKGESDGVDKALEQVIYHFLRQSKTSEGIIDTDKLNLVISGNWKKIAHTPSDEENLYRFADLLSTSIGNRDYCRQEICNIYGMRKFLKGLPSSFEQLSGDAAQLDLQRIWSEYMAFAYLFGMEKGTLKKLSCMIPEASQPALLYLMCSSHPHRVLVARLMQSASRATYYADDAVAANRGRLKIAWHAEEMYDFETH